MGVKYKNLKGREFAKKSAIISETNLWSNFIFMWHIWWTMVSAIISPIVNARSLNCAAEANHIVNLSPAVFTDPTIVWVDSCGYDIVIAIQRRSLIFALGGLTRRRQPSTNGLVQNTRGRES